MLKENNALRRKVLNRLAAELKNAGTEAVMIKEGEQGANTDIVNIVLSTVISRFGTLTAQFFFPPYNGAETVQYFTGLVTLSSSLGDMDKRRLAPIIERINCELPCGLFAVYDEVGLVYKLTVPLPEDLSEEQLFTLINLASGHAIALASSYARDF